MINENQEIKGLRIALFTICKFMTRLGMVSSFLLQIAFVCLVYPALVLSYAGQAAFISKHLIPHDDEVVCATHNPSSEYFHLRESVPNRK